MIKYTGVYARLLEQYILFKRHLGYKFVDAAYTYALFDRFSIENGEATIGITKELAEKWATKRPNESDSTRYRRVFYLAQFANFLNVSGYPSHVPRLPRTYKTTFTPHIFSKTELHSLFEASDRLGTTCNMSSCASVAPVLFRVLYGTGIRIGEAVALKDRDANLDEGYFVIRDSKNGQERMVPLSNSLTTVCRRYRESLRGVVVHGQHFFAAPNGSKCSAKATYEWFRKAIWKAEISHGGRGHGPRLHDLRHTFSVHSLATMAEAGLDLYYSLPILSKYLGHQSLEATDRYVRLTSEMYPNVLSDVNKICAYVFPEVAHHETY